MGEIADTMRSALRELAQADARLYRGLAEELGDGATAVEEPRALIQPEGGAPAMSAAACDLNKLFPGTAPLREAAKQPFFTVVNGPGDHRCL